MGFVCGWVFGIVICGELISESYFFYIYGEIRFLGFEIQMNRNLFLVNIYNNIQVF